MEESGSAVRITVDLQRIFVALAKAALKERPHDVHAFCLQQLKTLPSSTPGDCVGVLDVSRLPGNKAVPTDADPITPILRLAPTSSKALTTVAAADATAAVAAPAATRRGNETALSATMAKKSWLHAKAFPSARTDKPGDKDKGTANGGRGGIGKCDDGGGKIGDDDLAEFERDVSQVRTEAMPPRQSLSTRTRVYMSSDDEDDEDAQVVDLDRLSVLVSRRGLSRGAARFDDAVLSSGEEEEEEDVDVEDEDEEDVDDDVEAVRLCKVQSVPDDVDENGGARTHHPPVCALFARDGLEAGELDAEARRLEGDSRMQQLFAMWDGDGSGAVDFVELVIALHKFEGVGKRGIDIQVAADALVEFVESDTERELMLPQFAKVVIVFVCNNFGKRFDEVAEYMLAVAKSTSETAVLERAAGGDVREIERHDKEELEHMRETAECVSVNVENNIAKMRTTRGVPDKTRRGGSGGSGGPMLATFGAGDGSIVSGSLLSGGLLHGTGESSESGAE